MRIVIVGLGAIGSHAALALRNHPGEITVCDFDRIETKNTLSQMYVRHEVGRNKAQCTSAGLYDGWLIEAAKIERRIDDKNVIFAVKDAGLVLDCTDNAAARNVLKYGCKRAGDVPLLHGAMSADGTYAQVVWATHFKPNQEQSDASGGATCEDGENLPFHMLVGSMMAVIAQRFINDGRQTNVSINPTQVQRV